MIAEHNITYETPANAKKRAAREQDEKHAEMRRRVAGSRVATIAAENNPTGKFTKKAQRQVKWSTNRPPTSGPATLDTANITP